MVILLRLYGNLIGYSAGQHLFHLSLLLLIALTRSHISLPIPLPLQLDTGLLQVHDGNFEILNLTIEQLFEFLLVNLELL